MTPCNPFIWKYKGEEIPITELSKRQIKNEIWRLARLKEQEKKESRKALFSDLTLKLELEILRREGVCCI